MSVQWYPGHMTKAKRQIKELINKVDLVLEVRDARIPSSSANPDIGDILGGKPRMIILNKADLADPKMNNQWLEYFTSLELPAMLCSCNTGQLFKKNRREIQQYAVQYVRHSKVTGKPMRAPRLLVVGIPNVGKSSLINALAGKRAVRIGAKPGLTRGQQLINIQNNYQILDTPGVLWPKIDDHIAGIKLAATGAISDVGFSLDEIVGYVFEFLVSVNYLNATSLQDYLSDFAKMRGFLLSGNELDTERAKAVFSNEFKNGKYGNYTLDSLPIDVTANE